MPGPLPWVALESVGVHSYSDRWIPSAPTNKRHRRRPAAEIYLHLLQKLCSHKTPDRRRLIQLSFSVEKKNLPAYPSSAHTKRRIAAVWHRFRFRSKKNIFPHVPAKKTAETYQQLAWGPAPSTVSRRTWPVGLCTLADAAFGDNDDCSGNLQLFAWSVMYM